MDRSMGAIIEAMAQNIHVRLSCPVTHADYSEAASGRADPRRGGVVLTTGDGRKLRCRAAVFTVPLPILQQGVIGFTPALPPPKQAALSRIRMGNVIKIIVGFREKFWPEDMYDAVRACVGVVVVVVGGVLVCVLHSLAWADAPSMQTAHETV
jgi:monoamine oxidase